MAGTNTRSSIRELMRLLTRDGDEVQEDVVLEERVIHGERVHLRVE